MRWFRCLGEAVALSSMIILLLFFMVSTYNGLTNGIYKLVFDSNQFFEHYAELGVIVGGLLFYVLFRRVRFTLHPKKG